jgi:hypothetical protein
MGGPGDERFREDGAVQREADALASSNAFDDGLIGTAYNRAVFP